MARRKKKPEHRTPALVIHLTVAERREIERAAKEAGMTVEAFVKSLIVPPPPAHDEDAADKAEMDEWYQLARRASNRWANENPY